MLTAPTPPDEVQRLAELRSLNLLDTPAEARFDRIATLASRIFDVPIAYIALVDAERQWLKAKCGLSLQETPRDISFCGHAIMEDVPMVIPDAGADERFRDNPLVTGEPHIRFYAGCPLAGPNGHNVGTLCLADRRPRALLPHQVEILRRLGEMAEHELQLAHVIGVQRELLETKTRLIETQQRLREELEEAANYVRSLLPEPLTGAIESDWQFITSSQLGGDLLGYHWLDSRQLVIYLLDVMGHGVGAALLSSAVRSALRNRALPETRFDHPEEVLAALNRAFPMEQNADRYFTMWYGVYDVPTRTLRYANAGHPPAMLFQGPRKVAEFGATGMMVGAMPDVAYRTQEYVIPAESRLYLFSDGVFEVQTGDGDILTLGGLNAVIAAVAGQPGSRTRAILEQIQLAHGGRELPDDFSLMEIGFH